MTTVFHHTAFSREHDSIVLAIVSPCLTRTSQRGSEFEETWRRLSTFWRRSLEERDKLKQEGTVNDFWLDQLDPLFSSTVYLFFELAHSVATSQIEKQAIAGLIFEWPRFEPHKRSVQTPGVVAA